MAEAPETGWRVQLAAGRQILRILVRADRARSFGAAGLALAASLAAPLFAVLLGALVDAVVAGEESAALRAAGLIALLTLVAESAGIVSFRIRMRIRETGRHALTLHMAQAVGGAPGLEHLERPDLADRVELLRGAQHQLASLLDAVIVNLSTIATAVMTLAVLARVSPWFALLVAFGAPTVWAGARSAAAAEALAQRLTPTLRTMRHLSSVLQTREPAGEVRAFGLMPELTRRHEQLWAVAEKQRTRQALRAQGLQSAAWLLFAVGYLGALGLVLSRALAGQASVGDVVVVSTLGAQVRGVLTQLVGVATWLIDVLRSSERFAFVEQITSARPTPPTAEAPLRLTHGLDLIDVTFRYPGTEVDVLKGLTVHLPAGATVAVVGDNGAGKSTLVKLLARFYEPTSGEILVDGVRLDAMPVEQWRSRLSAGFQDFARLRLQALDSVGVGHHPVLDGDDAEQAVLDAMGRASAEAVLRDLPQGLATQLGTDFDDGVELSGGQWQQIALGRSMMRSSPLLLLLDEPTAALDARAEHELFSRYAGAADSSADTVGGITLLVSHRFSTVREADLILVLDGSSLVACGSHEQLMAERGLYAELYDLQARAYR